MSKTVESKVRLGQSDIHEQWERDYLNENLNRFYKEAFAQIVSELGDTKGKRLLDLGCGYCFHTVRLADSDLKITAADFSSAALREAKKTLRNAGLQTRVTLTKADATALPFADRSFDHVLIWGVLMHIPQVDKALSEAARVLKPGGKLVISENNAASIEARIIEPLVNFVRRLAGKRDRRRRRTEFGIEEWQESTVGGLMIRKTDMRALKRYCATLGLTLDKRIAGQFTELYARLPTNSLKCVIHAFNFAWFRHVRSPMLASSNLLFFIKVPSPSE